MTPGRAVFKTPVAAADGRNSGVSQKKTGMPRARRSQVVKLTQAKKRRGKAVKEGFLDTLADHLAAKAGLARSTPTPPTCPSMVDVDHVPMEVQASPSAVPYDHIYVIHIEGLRTSILQALRERIKPESKYFCFFYGFCAVPLMHFPFVL